MGEPAKNQGEGNRTADAAYRQGATKHAKDSDTKREARDAAETLDNDEGEELSEAEEEGKARAKGPVSR